MLPFFPRSFDLRLYTFNSIHFILSVLIFRLEMCNLNKFWNNLRTFLKAFFASTHLECRYTAGE